MRTLIILISLSFGGQAFGQYGSYQKKYGNRYGNDSNSMKVYDSNGNYRGNLNDNPYDPNSVSNPYGKYGSEYSSESINNPYNNFDVKY